MRISTHPIYQHGIARTPFGDCIVVTSPDGICRIDFIDTSVESHLAAIPDRWPSADHHRDDALAARLIDQALNDPMSLRLSASGTPFQHVVWNALRTIPYGTTISYQQLAADAGHPKAIRAAATAIANNPIAWLVPCHRVIRSDGNFGKYRWGEPRKRQMIDWEREHPQQGEFSLNPN